ncbi:hypothetical protein [Tistrella mobilis]|uniref:Uncharacterized protein n=1 Tax=Tistrella mobilis (strain KA081020-065) TaxID=1110502 RepID=I3TNA3_TISMK|nr:hypothetical protein [Tistrella mobilis]AFK54241.1 hypothetical protein TMO_2403 [Tistrella mobilis KA081020-065]
MNKINNLRSRADRLGLSIIRITTHAEARAEGGHIYTLAPVDWTDIEAEAAPVVTWSLTEMVAALTEIEAINAAIATEVRDIAMMEAGVARFSRR